MPKYSEDLDKLFKSIGFDNYIEMLKSAVAEKDALDEQNLIFFRTQANVQHPNELTEYKINFVFTVVIPEDNKSWYFKNIFACLVKKRHEKLEPTAEADYWPKNKSLPTKEQIIADVVGMARMDKLRAKLKIDNHDGQNFKNRKHPRPKL
jgi:hypothetical protein